MATVTARNSLKLTERQQKQIVKMFTEEHVTTYTEIAKRLQLKYVAVNKFMTKWKKHHGLLEAKRNAVKEADAVVNKVQINEAAPTITRDELRTVNQELKFLRKFYMERKKNEVTVQG